MGILGLTHDESGNSLQKLPVAIKVAIGEPPDPKEPKSHPKRLDHFIFKRRSQEGLDMVWKEDPAIAKVYGTNPREVEVIFMDDSLDNVLKTNYAWWGASECKCSGELVQIGDTWQMQAVRKTERAPQGEPWPGTYKYTAGDKKGQPVEPCGDGCPDLEEGRCKPSGTLYFCLAKFPMVGAIACIRTTSYRSIRNLSNALMQIREITGGRLAGIRMVLHAAPEKITFDAGDKKRSSIMHILSLRVDAPDMKQLVEHMTETARLFKQTKQLGTGNKVIDYVPEDTDEKERAIEMQEFHDPHPSAPEPEPERNEDEEKLKITVRDLCKDLGHNRAHFLSLLGQFKSDLPKLVEQLKKELYEKRKAAEPAPPVARRNREPEPEPEAKPVDPKDDWLPESMNDPTPTATVAPTVAPEAPVEKKPPTPRKQGGLSF